MMKFIKLTILLFCFNALSFGQGFDIYRIYDLTILGEDEISGNVVDTIANEEGGTVQVRFSVVNRTGELQRMRIERLRMEHAEGTQDAMSYAASGGLMSFSFGFFHPPPSIS